MPGQPGGEAGSGGSGAQAPGGPQLSTIWRDQHSFRAWQSVLDAICVVEILALIELIQEGCGDALAIVVVMR